MPDADRYPAHELVDLYHRRWQVETTYFSIKTTLLDGRVLRSRNLQDLDQEVYALLTAYHTLIRTAGDALAARPGTPMERVSFTVLLQATTDQAVNATGILPTGPAALLGANGQAVLDGLLPAHRRQRIKAHTRKNPTSKYGPNADAHPQQAQTHTLEVRAEHLRAGLTARRRT
ncbi:transposase [Streptomyces sp. NPDC058877]|uniref:transposase n=1 Tax=Streptomyces sp. NPDC058877 TaxID=3346665 RepID=UPI0036B1DD7D